MTSPRGASLILVGLAIALMSCSKDRGEARPAEQAAAEIPEPHMPTRTAVEDHDLRVLIAEVAAARACDRIRGQFRPLRASDRPGVVTGVLMFEDCRITQRGTKVTFHLQGRGWQWASRTQDKAGASFAVRQYVRFEIDSTIPGALDVAYDTDAHVLSLWFTPSQLPEVVFTPIGTIAVDEQGAWAEVVGALGSAIGKAPDDEAGKQAKAQGARDFKQQLADGMAVTIDVCTGLTRFGMGRPYQGKMMPPDAGETARIPGELQPGGLLIFGPYPAPRGFTMKADVSAGTARVELMCADQAERLAEQFLAGDGNRVAVAVLVGKDVRGKATLRSKRPRCPVAVVVRPRSGPDPVVFDWVRPTKEAAAALGGPMIRCDR